jgi:F-type H+-transporting ATPase subunit b
MLIDWFTVVAQVVNFLILVWLLKRFLYHPILNAIDAREKRIATQMADADSKVNEAKKEREEYKRKNEQIDKQRATLMAEALSAANIERQRLLDDARQAADAISIQRQDALNREARDLNQALIHRIGQEVFAISRKALMDLAATTLEEHMVVVFVRRLMEMDGHAKTELARTIKATSAPAILRSAFAMTDLQHEAIQCALEENLEARITVLYEIDQDLICGIELVLNGHKIAWSIADYLVSMKGQVDQILNELGKPGSHERGN